MKVHSVIRKGEDHLVFCEDFILNSDQGRYFVGFVFDGCSGGRDSHFASSLFGKIFNNSLEEAFKGVDIESYSKNIFQNFTKKLFEIKVSLGLLEDDLTSTILILIYDKVHGEAIVLSVGDGVICCDGELIELENERFKILNPENYQNMPNYVCYDINELGIDKGYFDVWYENNVKIHKFINPKDISISSDGILTFKVNEGDIDPVDFLLKDQNWMNNKIMLSKKANVLKSKYKAIHKDDLSIIRLILNLEKNDNSDNSQGES